MVSNLEIGNWEIGNFDSINNNGRWGVGGGVSKGYLMCGLVCE
jgi:hypothetical protein